MVVCSLTFFGDEFGQQLAEVSAGFWVRVGRRLLLEADGAGESTVLGHAGVQLWGEWTVTGVRRRGAGTTQTRDRKSSQDHAHAHSAVHPANMMEREEKKKESELVSFFIVKYVYFLEGSDLFNENYHSLL